MRIVTSRVLWFGRAGEWRSYCSVLNVFPRRILDPLCIKTISLFYRMLSQFIHILPQSLLRVGAQESVDEILRFWRGMLILQFADKNFLQRFSGGVTVKRKLAFGKLYLRNLRHGYHRADSLTYTNRKKKWFLCWGAFQETLFPDIRPSYNRGRKRPSWTLKTPSIGYIHPDLGGHSLIPVHRRGNLAHEESGSLG